MKQLGGWQRVGIMLSIIWVLGAAFYERNSQVQAAKELGQFEYWLCTKDLTEECMRHASGKSREAWLLDTGKIGNVLGVAVLPVVLSWLLVWHGVAVGRWIRAGFQADK